MGLNLLILGAAGYIGGSLLADLVTSFSPLFELANINAIVRTDGQAGALSKLGVDVIVVDLGDESAVTKAIIDHEIDVVINTASSFDADIVSGLFKALGQRRTISGKETYIIHSSVAAVFSPEAGWTFEGEVNDSENLYAQGKQLRNAHPVRDMNLLVVEEAKKYGVTAFNIVIPIVYGRGIGECKKLSAFIPAVIRTAIMQKAVYKFDSDGNPPAIHISDLTMLYILLLQNLSQGNTIPSGEKGYYFAVAHSTSTWETLEHIAQSLSRRGLVTESTLKVWSSDEMAAESLHYPLPFVRTMAGTYGNKYVPDNTYALGWEPKWDKKSYLQSMDDEVEAVLQAGTVQVSTFNALLSSPKK